MHAALPRPAGSASPTPRSPPQRAHVRYHNTCLNTPTQTPIDRQPHHLITAPNHPSKTRSPGLPITAPTHPPTHLPPPPPLQVTQLGHVKDLAVAFLKCLGNPKASRQVYNISGER